MSSRTTADAPPVVARARTDHARGLSLLLSCVGLVAAGLTLAFPDELTGPAVIRGNMHGTALVVAVIALGLWLLSVVRVHSSPRYEAVRGAAVAYLLYQGVMFSLATPYNRFFLVYVAFLGAGIWAATEVVRRLHDRPTCSTLSRRARHVVAGAYLALAVLNSVAWLLRIVPSIIAADPAQALQGSGLTTNPVWLQDLAFWIPAYLISGVGLWRTGRSAVQSGALLVFFALELFGIAVDQWYGAAADPGHPSLADASMTPVLIVAAAVVLVPALVLVRSLRPGRYLAQNPSTVINERGTR